MYLDMWRILRKRVSENWGSMSQGTILRMMDNLEADMKAQINWERNANTGLKHLRKIGSWDGGLNEDHIDLNE